MKLIAYIIDGHKLDIRPAPLEREWMESTDQRFAYRCLPLNIANAHGWEILCPSTFTAIWNGGSGLKAVQIQASSPTPAPAISHFGKGILTFHIPCLFRTESGFDLIAQGPISRPKDSIAPLSGIIETDWAPYTFTMNWIFTRPGVSIRFEQGEPFCHIYPVRRGELEGVNPQVQMLSQEPELKRQFELWINSRSQFNAGLKQRGSAAQIEQWQKLYYRGVDAAGQSTSASDHRTRLRLRPFQLKQHQP
jgi:hypothetical protein